jgi:hypothetical protein
VWGTKKLQTPASDSPKRSGESIGDRTEDRAHVAIGARVRPAFLSPAALDANDIFKNQSAIFAPNGIAGMFSAVDEDCDS